MNKYRENLLNSHQEADWDEHGCFTLAHMVKRFKVKIMAEVGVCFGHTASEVLALNQVEKYFMIDNWASDEIYMKVKDNFQDSCIEIIKEDSMTAIKRIDGGSLDLVYINGRTYKRTIEDLQGWYKKLKVGGILLGDGFNHPTYGVKQAVHRVFPKECINVNLSKDSNYWVFKELV